MGLHADPREPCSVGFKVEFPTGVIRWYRRSRQIPPQ